jgi:hypothetical protein
VELRKFEGLGKFEKFWKVLRIQCKLSKSVASCQGKCTLSDNAVNYSNLSKFPQIPQFSSIFLNFSQIYPNLLNFSQFFSPSQGPSPANSVTVIHRARAASSSVILTSSGAAQLEIMDEDSQIPVIQPSLSVDHQR